jgi:hypothetical protein
MTKLSDTANVILTTAANRDDRRVLPLPSLKAPPVAVRKTINSLLADALIEGIPAARDDEAWESEQHGRITLAVTAAGLAAVGIEEETGPAKPAKGRTGGKKRRGAAKVAKSTSGARKGDTGGKKDSKQSVVIALLRRGQGASIEEMMEATGWQAHSVRGFMSGALKKRLQLEVVSEKDPQSGERRYYVAAVRSRP